MQSVDTVLRGHAGDAPAGPDDADVETRFGLDARLAIALPHREKFTAKAHILFDNKHLLGGSRFDRRYSVTGLFQLLGQNLNITPDDRVITQIVDKFSGRLTERREFFARARCEVARSVRACVRSPRFAAATGRSTFRRSLRAFARRQKVY